MHMFTFVMCASYELLQISPCSCWFNTWQAPRQVHLPAADQSPLGVGLLLDGCSLNLYRKKRVTKRKGCKLCDTLTATVFCRSELAFASLFGLGPGDSRRRRRHDSGTSSRSKISGGGNPPKKKHRPLFGDFSTTRSGYSPWLPGLPGPHGKHLLRAFQQWRLRNHQRWKHHQGTARKLKASG